MTQRREGKRRNTCRADEHLNDVFPRLVLMPMIHHPSHPELGKVISASPSTISGLQRDGNRSTQSEAGSINQGIRVCARCSARDQFALLSSYASRRAITPHQSTLSLSVPCSATRVAVPEPDGDRYVFQCRRSPP